MAKLHNEAVADDFSAENYFSSTASSIDLDPERSYRDFFKHPEYSLAIKEHFDIRDNETRKALLYVTEADQGQILTSLTSKLYDSIVSKANEIDYGDIPASKGDITKLANYEKIMETTELLQKILKEYRQNTGPVDEISTCISNIRNHKELFTKAFRYNVELPMLMYCNAVLSVITGISYMIANCIEFIKAPKQDTFDIVLDKMALNRTKDNLVYGNIKRFNAACKNGDMEKAVNHVINTKIKNEAAPLVIAAAIGSVALVLNLIPILREMVYFFYFTRTRVSDFFDIQADLLQMNAYNIQHNEILDPAEKDSIVKKQLNIVDLFRRASRKFSITGKEAEVKTSKEIASESKKLKYTDVMDELPQGASALF